MTPENDLMAKCLDIVNQIVTKNLKSYMSVKIGSEFSFNFSNSESFQKKLSPSQRTRNFERQKVFNAKKDKENKSEDISVQTEHKVREIGVQPCDIDKEPNTEINNSSSETNTKTTSSKLDNSTQPSKPKISSKTISLHPNFKCYLCDQMYPSKTDLINHHNSKHSGNPKKFACEDCDENWIHEVMLNSHKQTEHNIFVCARCNNQFYGKENLDVHIRKKHNAF